MDKSTSSVNVITCYRLELLHMHQPRVVVERRQGPPPRLALSQGVGSVRRGGADLVADDIEAGGSRCVRAWIWRSFNDHNDAAR